MPEKIVKKPISVKGALDKKQYIIIPSFAVMNERFYYGYTVFAIAFGWLHFRFKIEFGVQKVVWNDESEDDCYE